MCPAERLEAMLLLETLPIYLIPSELTDPQTKRSPLTYPPCPLSQVLRVPGFQFFPAPESAMATELMRHPALHMVLADVPSFQLPHLESHCLYRGQLLEVARVTSTAIKITLAIIFVDIQSIIISNRQILNSPQSQFFQGVDLRKQRQRGWLFKMFERVVQQYQSMNKVKTRKKINNYVIHLDEPLGSGAYATVYKAHDQSSHTPLAAKIIERAKMQANVYTARAIKLQISIHQSLIHPNIVRVQDIVQTPNNYYIFQEYCSGGNLRKLLQASEGRRFSQADAIHCLKCVCAAFQPMFEKGVIHRDLKPQNIVIQENQLKLTDFGFAKAMASSRQLTHTVIGTPLYMSPQILAKQPYTSKCDVWSIGILFYQMLFGQHPWLGKGLADLYNKISSTKQVSFPPEIEVSQLSKSLIIQCLRFQENDRLSWMELYEHSLWDVTFHHIAHSWRGGYQLAQERVEQLRQTTQIQVLVGVFLRVRTPALNFPQFYAIMHSLIEDLEQKQAGMMYQLFDKDSNGVIDLLQFTTQLSNYPQPPLSLLSQLICQQHYYQQLSCQTKFQQLTQSYPQSIRIDAFGIIANMNY